MEKELAKAFHKAKYEQNRDLALNIWQNIMKHDKRVLRIKLWVFSSIGLLSFVGIIPAFKMLLADLSQSGLYEYFSLIFSSGNSIFSYWKELILSIAESLPTMSIVLTFSLVFILFLSIKYAVKQIIKGQSSPMGFSLLSI